MAGLTQQLDIYAERGIPKLHHQVAFHYQDEVEEGKKKKMNDQVFFFIEKGGY